MFQISFQFLDSRYKHKFFKYNILFCEFGAGCMYIPSKRDSSVTSQEKLTSKVVALCAEKSHMTLDKGLKVASTGSAGWFSLVSHVFAVTWTSTLTGLLRGLENPQQGAPPHFSVSVWSLHMIFPATCAGLLASRLPRCVSENRKKQIEPEKSHSVILSIRRESLSSSN